MGSPPYVGTLVRCRRRRLVATGAVVIVAILVTGAASVGCSSSGGEESRGERPDPFPSATATTTATSSSHRYSVNRFSLTLPESWQQTSLSDPLAQEDIDEMLAENPSMADVVGDRTSLSDSYVAMIAGDPATGSFLSVIDQPALGAPATPTDEELEEAVPDLIASMEESGARITGHEIVTINGRRAIKLRFALPLTTDGVTDELKGLIYVVPTSDRLHIVTIVGDDDVAEDIIATFSIE